MRHPAGFSDGSAPPAPVGRLPTTTQPPGRIDNAVVSPMPPGQAIPVGSDPIVANVPTVPRGHLHDRCPGPLHVRLVIEVADERVSFGELPHCFWHDGDPVRVDITVARHRGHHLPRLAERQEERLARGRPSSRCGCDSADPANVNPAASRILSDDRVALWADLMGIWSCISSRARRLGSYYGGIRRGLFQGLREADSPR